MLQMRIVSIFWFAMIFFSRGDSTFSVLREDIHLRESSLVFVETRFKRKRYSTLMNRTIEDFYDDAKGFL